MSKYSQCMLKYMNLIEEKAKVSDELYELSCEINDWFKQYHAEEGIVSDEITRNRRAFIKERVAEYFSNVERQKQLNKEIDVASAEVPPVRGCRSVVFLIPGTQDFEDIKAYHIPRAQKRRHRVHK